jgi:hypothetical protein
MAARDYHSIGEHGMKYEPINDLARQELNDIKRIGKVVKGRQELINHLVGKQLTAREAMKAQCYLCMGYHSDGRNLQDCEEKTCPLYPYNPYSSTPVPKKKVSEKLIENIRKGTGAVKKDLVSAQYAGRKKV